MKQIASFSINHDILVPGLYISRVDGDAVTYDLRMKCPNKGDYLSNGVLHTLEHLVATYVRNTEFSDTIIYVGPMGCRTGFYVVTRESLAKEDMITLMQDAFRFTAAFEGEIPGAKQRECGNYREHDLIGCNKEAAAYLKVLENCTVESMKYPE